MRKAFTVVPVMILMLQSCNLIYHPIHFEKTYENNTIVIKEKKLKNNGRNCLSKEITTKKDSPHNQIVYKEVITYDCRGAYSYEVKRKTWTLDNGKKVVTILKK